MQFFDVSSEEGMLQLGKGWASQLDGGAVVFLCGDLGSGKTTLVRGILQGMGHNGIVTSPTYTLIEHYSLACGEVYHVDLYRLDDPAELETIGLRDVLDSASALLVEWPQRGIGKIPSPNFEVDISYHGDGRRVQVHSNNGVELSG